MATTDTLAVSAAPGEHGVRSSAHDRQIGAFIEFERVMLPGLSYGVWRGLEIGAGAVIGYYKGPWLGLRYLLFEGPIKPGLMVAMPMFVVDGRVHPGVQAGATLQWDPSHYFGIYANLGVSYLSGADSNMGAVWFVPGIGVQVRL
jgi:hypothetical protein